MVMDRRRSWDKTLNSLTETYKNEINRINQKYHVDFCCDNEKIRRVVEHSLKEYEGFRQYAGKNNKISFDKRIQGNKKFKEGKYEECLSLYTESIVHAQVDNENLPLAYSNRALALQNMGHLTESLQDIELALSTGYPREKSEKLILRKTKCLIMLGESEKAHEFLKDNLQGSHNEDFVSTMWEKLKSTNEEKFEGMAERKSFHLPLLVGGENENFPSASAHLKVCHNARKGRHVIAVKDIKTGDVLFVEKPFACVIFKEVCQNCCKQVLAPIPCDFCVEVFYCCLECKDNFWKTVHSFECGFGELFKSIGIAHLSLRIVLAASSNYLEFKRHLDDLDGLKSTNLFCGSDYSSVYNLVTHDEKHEPSDSFQYVMTALLLGVYLKNYTSYFGNADGNAELKKVVFMLWRHILQLICNGHAIDCISLNDSSAVTVIEREQRIGTAIYPSVSMMNHSCESSIIHSFYMNYIIVRASKPIKKGEEVFNCYGPDARRMIRAKRQEILSKQYFFQCECEACSQKYDIQEIFTAFKCKNCGGPSVPKNEEEPKNRICLDCGENSNITEKYLQIQNSIYALLKEGESLIDKDLNSALKKFLSSWRLGKEIFYKFHKDLGFAADEVARCLAMMEDFRRCAMFLKCSVISVEKRFGYFSIELANELIKLGTAISRHCHKAEKSKRRELAAEGLECYKKCEEILNLLYGHRNPCKKVIDENHFGLISYSNNTLKLN